MVFLTDNSCQGGRSRRLVRELTKYQLSGSINVCCGLLRKKQRQVKQETSPVYEVK